MDFFKGLIGFMRCTATWVHASLKKIYIYIYFSHILPVLYTAFLLASKQPV